MAKGAPTMDLAVMLGAPKKGAGKAPPSDLDVELEGPESGEMETGGDEELPPAFDLAADEFLDDTLSPDERKQALYRAIQACHPTE
jgi:hypothetical protein